MSKLSLADFYKWLREKGHGDFSIKNMDKSELYRVAERKEK